MRAKEICNKLCNQEAFCHNCHLLNKEYICCFECNENDLYNTTPCGHKLDDGILFKYAILKNKLIREGYLNEQPNNNTIGL
jgi:hypothetical protein